MKFEDLAKLYEEKKKKYGPGAINAFQSY